MRGFLPFSFFLAYGVISIPAGSFVEKFGARKALLLAFGLNFAGALPIALMPDYAVVIGGLFVIGLGMAMLQVVINPLMRTAGGEEHFAFYSVLAQLVFGFASYVSPFVLAWLIRHAADLPTRLPWVTFYWGFALLFIALIVVTRAISLPAVTLSVNERSGSVATYRALLRDRHVRIFFLGIVAYVGTEQSLANWMSQFLFTYHGVPPNSAGAEAVGRFWGLMSLGCLLGLALLKLLDSRVVLAAFTLAALACLAPVRFGRHRITRVSRLRFLPVRHVLRDLLAVAEFGATAPRRAVGNPLYGNSRRRRRAAARRAARRLVGTQGGLGDGVRHAGVHPRHQLLGAAVGAQRNARLEGAPAASRFV